ATRRWAISARWSLSGAMRAVTLNYLSTSSGTDQSVSLCLHVYFELGWHVKLFFWIAYIFFLNQILNR
ncbi:hypothetical protein, partial [Pseudomonas aeruginosa]|uniref:hypothetical protein n=1 Tax=Pseudomonas aeruginosa TaxID=287 RepID=UPI001CD9BCB7